MCDMCVAQDRRNQDTADEAVERGIAWLDQNGPANWRELVDLDTLDIDSPDNCVLGQVFVGKAYNPEYTRPVRWSDRRLEFHSGYDYAVITLLGDRFSDSITGVYGFSSWGGVEGDTMTAAWQRALTA